jgi:hypothetical protein
MEFYKIFTKESQSLIDIALQEYGHVDGVFYLLEDNPGVLINTTDEPEPGTVIYIREKPEVADLKRLDYVRKGRIAAVTTNTNLYVLVSNASDAEKQAIADALGLTGGGSVNILKLDNFTVLLELEGGENIRTKDVLAAMTVNEIIADLLANDQLTSLLSNFPVIIKDQDDNEIDSVAPDGEYQVTVFDTIDGGDAFTTYTDEIVDL